MKRFICSFGCLLIVVSVMGCATTRYEEFGAPPTEAIAKNAVSETVPVLEQRMIVLEERVARLEAELAGRFSGLEASQGDLATRLMSLAEQLEAVSRQLQDLDKVDMPAKKPAAVPQAVPSPPVQDLSRLYEQALSAYYDRRYVEAQDKFEQVLDLAPQGEWSDNAQYWVGECEYGKKNYQAALDAFHRVFQFGKTEKDDDAQFMLGQCYYYLDNFDNALVEFNRLKIDYPESEYLGRADAYIRKIRAAQSESR